MLKQMKKVKVDENKDTEIHQCKFQMMSGSYGKFQTVKQHMERLMGNMAKGAGDHLAMTIALDLGLCRWTIKPKQRQS